MDPVRTLVLVAALAVGTLLLLRVFRVPAGWDPVWSIVRAVAQLAALALILTWVFSSLGWTFLWLAVMYVVAVVTSARRIGWSPRVVVAVASGIALALGVTVSLVFVSGVIALGPQYLLAVGGILMGNTMNIASLSAKRLQEQLIDHRDEVEGWLALGATPRRAMREFRAKAASFSLIPQFDSAKVTGLVTLPGAFVGSLFAGANPVDAGLFQLVVIVGINFSGAIVAVIVTEALGAPTRIPMSDVAGEAQARLPRFTAHQEAA